MDVELHDIFEQLCAFINPDGMISLYKSCRTFRATVGEYLRLIVSTHLHDGLLAKSFWSAVFLYRCETSYSPLYRDIRERNLLAIVRGDREEYKNPTIDIEHRALGLKHMRYWTFDNKDYTTLLDLCNGAPPPRIDIRADFRWFVLFVLYSAFYVKELDHVMKLISDMYFSVEGIRLTEDCSIIDTIGLNESQRQNPFTEMMRGRLFRDDLEGAKIVYEHYHSKIRWCGTSDDEIIGSKIMSYGPRVVEWMLSLKYFDGLVERSMLVRYVFSCCDTDAILALVKTIGISATLASLDTDAIVRSIVSLNTRIMPILRSLDAERWKTIGDRLIEGSSPPAAILLFLRTSGIVPDQEMLMRAVRCNNSHCVELLIRLMGDRVDWNALKESTPGMMLGIHIMNLDLAANGWTERWSSKLLLS